MKLFKAKNYEKIKKEEPCIFTSPLGEVRLEVYYGPEGEKLDNLVTEPDKAEVYQLPSGAWVSSWETEEFILEVLISPLYDLCPKGREVEIYGCLYRVLPKVLCTDKFKFVMRLIDKYSDIWREFDGDDTSNLVLLEYKYKHKNRELCRNIAMSVPAYEFAYENGWMHHLGIPQYIINSGLQELEYNGGLLHMFEDSKNNSGFTEVFFNLKENILFQCMYFSGWLKEVQYFYGGEENDEVYQNIDFDDDSLNRVLDSAGCSRKF